MTREHKQQIRDALMRYALKYPNQKTAAESLDGISATTLSSVKHNKWELISDHMWLHIARQVGFYCAENWQQADTSGYLLLKILFGDAQHYAMVYGVAMPTGLGKTFCSKHYASNNAYAHYICCNESMNRKSFLKLLLHTISKEEDDTHTLPADTTETLLQKVVSTLETQEEPLLIIDDAHKLKERVLHFIVALYRRLINDCGIVLLSNDSFRTRLVEGARMQKPVYEELYNTIGRRFVTLGKTGPKDVALICKANGLQDTSLIAGIEKACVGNLSKIDKLIHRVLQQQPITIGN